MPERLTPIFVCTPRGGVPVFSKRAAQDLRAWLQTLEGQEVWAQFAKKKKRRSDNQNAYYWGVVVKMLGDHLGMTPEEVHDALKWKFLRKSVSGLDTTRSTASLTTTNFEDYLQAVRTWASTELAFNLPLPNEVDFSAYY